jgi:hypothetical protein
MNKRDAAASRCVQMRPAMVTPNDRTRVPIKENQTPPRGMKTMFKTLSAALIAASMLIAPVAANAAQPATAPATTTKTDSLVTPHKRHVVKHHARSKFAKHARHHNKFVSHKRHGKFVKAHIRHGKFVKAHKAHGKIVKVSKTQKHTIAKKVRTSAK